jgi:hypothetical protein
MKLINCEELLFIAGHPILPLKQQTLQGLRYLRDVFSRPANYNLHIIDFAKNTAAIDEVSREIASRNYGRQVKPMATHSLRRPPRFAGCPVNNTGAGGAQISSPHQN